MIIIITYVYVYIMYKYTHCHWYVLFMAWKPLSPGSKESVRARRGGRARLSSLLPGRSSSSPPRRYSVPVTHGPVNCQKDRCLRTQFTIFFKFYKVFAEFFNVLYWGAESFFSTFENAFYFVCFHFTITACSS